MKTPPAVRYLILVPLLIVGLSGCDLVPAYTPEAALPTEEPEATVGPVPTETLPPGITRLVFWEPFALDRPQGLLLGEMIREFEAENPEMGNATYTSTHDGVDYYFASQAAQATFEADPTAHLPQFGGFCAFGVYVGKKLDGDVRYADIVDDKLYLFVNEDIFKKYLEDKETVIQGALAKWTDIHHTPVGSL